MLNNIWFSLKIHLFYPIRDTELFSGVEINLFIEFLSNKN